MSSDRDGIRGGWATPGDDQPDDESAIEMTGEFTIDYAPPAWYTQNSSGASGASAQASPPPTPASGTAMPPPVGPAFPVPAPPDSSGFQAGWAPSAAAPPPAVQPPAVPAEEEPENGDLESGATMRISSAALKREIAERSAGAEITSAQGDAETPAAAEAPAEVSVGDGGSVEGTEGTAGAEGSGADDAESGSGEPEFEGEVPETGATEDPDAAEVNTQDEGGTVAGTDAGDSTESTDSPDGESTDAPVDEAAGDLTDDPEDESGSPDATTPAPTPTPEADSP
ncbi:SCO5717 family growth-regulating ATPase, partial [Streptomyces sp. Agncl-13]|uniref:SCO5717 family growth-regulating ATPase n=1 Tax=Streptomyces sp. Agncl-13 TaxID=3400628 RepID=UPI003A85BAC9